MLLDTKISKFFRNFQISLFAKLGILFFKNPKFQTSLLQPATAKSSP